MKRVLVLTNEGATHPFRSTMPLQAFAPITVHLPRSDFAFFMASFISGFIIIFGMIA
jgi:hypothetical protein